MLKWEHLFVHSDLDLGKTALIKHKKQLMDQMPFKEHYWCILPHMYNDMRAHIQEMLDIGAIHKSQSVGKHSSPSPEEGCWPEVLHQPQEIQ